MLTLVTGTPGAGKSLYWVWHLARPVPGSTVERDGDAIPRRLLSNIKNLCLEHTPITADDLNNWHTWAQPGDVIVFDEVQEVWRGRGLGAKVPECIAALETHRHMGVDLVLITQHPGLIDPNIRKLVNQHLHLRRLAKTIAMVYEWDHCGTPGVYKSCLQSKAWFHPKEAYALYKSAQVHTKPTARFPRIAVVGALAVCGVIVGVPMAYGRIAARFEPPKKEEKAKSVVSATPALVTAQPELAPQALPGAPVAVASSPRDLVASIKPMGCIAMGKRCDCFDAAGVRMMMELSACREGSERVGYVVPAAASYAAPAARSAASAGGVGVVDPDDQPTAPIIIGSERPRPGASSTSSGGRVMSSKEVPVGSRGGVVPPKRG